MENNETDSVCEEFSKITDLSLQNVNIMKGPSLPPEKAEVDCYRLKEIEDREMTTKCKADPWLSDYKGHFGDICGNSSMDSVLSY